jgi:hypothetical protein
MSVGRGAARLGCELEHNGFKVELLMRTVIRALEVVGDPA